MLHLNKVLTIRTRFDHLFVNLQHTLEQLARPGSVAVIWLKNFSTHLMPLGKVVILSAC